MDYMRDPKHKAEIVAYYEKIWSMPAATAASAYQMLVAALTTNGLVPTSALKQELALTKQAIGDTDDVPLSQIWDFRLLRLDLAQMTKKTAAK
jgi:hypothetical protein